MIVYKATNKLNGKSYIGQTTYTIKHRKKDHLSAARTRSDNSVFHKAIRKYGSTVFVWEILSYCKNKSELDLLEAKFIKFYKSHVSNGGYNLTYGGEGMCGYQPSHKTRSIWKQQRLGNQHAKGFKHSEAFKKAMRSRMSGNRNPMAGTKSPMRGKVGSDNHRFKKYVIICPDESSFVVHGIKNFCDNFKEERLHYSALIKVAKNKQVVHKGYKCRDYDDNLDYCLPCWGI